MPIPEDVIKRGWITAGDGELWGTKGTYAPIEYPRLPALPAVLSPFDWLSSIPKRDYGCTLNSDENKLAGFAGIQAEARSLGFHIPDDFEILVKQPEIQARIPTCTACYLELSNALVPFPGFSDSYAVRFMNDSQSCVLWYLLFQRDKPVRVMACGCFIERDLFDLMEYQSEVGRPLPYEDVLKDSCICAESFGEFVFRFCIENALWFAMHDKLSLSPCELDYLNHARQAPN
jgi:hypothetical protein